MVAIKDFEMPNTCGDCPCCIHTADEKRYIGYCNTSDDDYYCKALDRFMEYDEVDGGVDILGKPLDCPLVEAIPKDQYEARLKGDLEAILVELQMEIEELENPLDYDFEGYNQCAVDCEKIIQQKINALRGNE